MKLEKILLGIVKVGLFVLPVAPLLVTNSLLFPFISGKAFFFRIIIEVVFACWLALALIDKSFRPARSLFLFALLALLLAVSAATAFSQNPYRSFWSNYERMEGLISYFHLFAYFLVLLSVVKTQKFWAWLAHASLGVNLIVGIYAVLQLLGKISISRGVSGVDATFGNSTYLAVYELFHVFILAFIIYRLLAGTRAGGAGRLWLAGVYGALLVFDAFLLFKTGTRGAILGLIFGVLAAAAVTVWRERGRPLVRKTAIGVLAAVLFTVGVFWTLRNAEFVKTSPVLSRLASISVEAGRPRFMVWRTSLEGFQERPILGWGPENYILVFNKFYNPGMYKQEAWFDRSHNVVFDWLISAGLLGLLAYLSLFAAAFYYLLLKPNGRISAVGRGIFAGLLIGYFIHNIFVFDNLVSYLLFFGILAYLHWTFASTPDDAPVLEQRALSPGYRWAVALLGGSILIPVLYFANVKPMLASAALIDALSLSRNPAEGFRHFKRVFTYNTFVATEATEQLLNRSFEVAGRSDVADEVKKEYLVFAREKIEETVARESKNSRYHLFAGSFLLQLGEVDAAIARLEKAVELSPNKQLTLFRLGQAYLVKGDSDRALAVYQKAYELAPDFEEARNFLINLYVELKRYNQVLELWRETVLTDPTNIQHRFSLAAAYLVNGKRQEAVLELEEAIKLDPGAREQAEGLIKEIRAGRNPLDNN